MSSSTSTPIAEELIKITEKLTHSREFDHAFRTINASLKEETDENRLALSKGYESYFKVVNAIASDPSKLRTLPLHEIQLYGSILTTVAVFSRALLEDTAASKPATVFAGSTSQEEKYTPPTYVPPAPMSGGPGSIN